MGYIGQGKARIAGQTTPARYAYILLRGQRLKWTKTKVISRIVEMWFEADCPPLSELDALAPRLPFVDENLPELAPSTAMAGSHRR
jgi:hypothetical protein